MQKTATPKRNILQIFASPVWGGGEQYVFDLSRHLIHSGYDVVFVSRTSEDIEQRLKNIEKEAVVLPLKFLFDLYSIFRLSRIIDKHKIEVIHTHLFKDTFIALFARILSSQSPKVIMTRHLVKKGKQGKLYTWLYKRVAKIIFVSELAKNEFLSSAPLIADSKIKVIHNSIAPSEERGETKNICSHHEIGEETVALAFVGRIVKGKGVEVLIDAIAPLKELKFHLFFIGKGSEEYLHTIQSKIQKHGIGDKITFLGFIDNVSPYISQVDIGILPSIWKESFGLAAIEFMQVGKAVIGTNNGALTEIIVPEKTGMLVPPEDVQALSDAIKTLIENKAKRTLLGENAKKRFEEDFSYDIFFRKILDVYREESAL